MGVVEISEKRFQEIRVEMARNIWCNGLRGVGIDDSSAPGVPGIAKILRLTEEEVGEAIATMYDDLGGGS